MKLLGDLLDKYKNLVPTDSIKKEAVIEVLSKRFDIVVDKKCISVSNNVIHLKCSPRLKGEVFIHKTAILRELEGILKQNTPKDIR